MSTRQSIVKISPPKVSKTFSRVKLHEQLHLAQQGVVWLSAPAGAGKTTLVADYLTHHALSALWYQLDASDSDLASFFHYFTLAVKHRLVLEDSLPVLAPEYYGNLAVFMRRFTERLCVSLNAPLVLVFDNFHDLPNESPLQLLFIELIANLTDRCRIFFLSRTQPPAWLARFIAQDSVYQLTNNHLRLSVEEAKGIIKLLASRTEAKPSQADISKMHSIVDGWAAGLVLLYRTWQQYPALASLLANECSHALIFDYFANELFNGLPIETKTILLQSALLPVMSTDLVKELTANLQSDLILYNLYKRNFFLTVSGQPNFIYKYHPLFREFLLKQGEYYWDSAGLRQLQSRAAQLLLQHDHIEAAIDLSLTAQDWPVVVSSLLTYAPKLLAQGRSQTLAIWLRRLPMDLIKADPWLLYYQGTVLGVFDSTQAAACFDSAYPLFLQQGDITGCYQTLAAAILLSWMTKQNHHGIDQWLERFDQLYGEYPAIASSDLETKVVSAVLMGMYYRRPDHPRAESLLERAHALWTLPLETSLRWQLGSAIGFYISGRGNLIQWGKTLRLYEIAQTDANASPLEHLHLFLSLAFVDCFAGDYASSLSYINKGFALAEKSGIELYHLFLLAVATYNALMQAKLIQADEYLEKIRVFVAQQPPNFHTAHYQLLLNWRSLVVGDFNNAVIYGRAALALALANGAVYPLARCRHGLALALVAVNQIPEALSLLEQARIPWGSSRFQQLLYDTDLSEAWIWLRLNNEAKAIYLLTRALTQGQKQGWGLPLWSFSQWLEPLLRFALEQNIAVDHVQHLIRQADFKPTSTFQLPLHWPLPIHIYTLGHFEVRHDGQILLESPLAKSRPLEMLKILIAWGGRDIADTRLMDVLWAEASGDAAVNAFNTTLHRLRKILGVDQAIVLKDHLLSLNAQSIWLDVWSLEDTLKLIQQQLEDPTPNYKKIKHLWATADQLYQGDFLSKSIRQPWTLTITERLHKRMLSITLAVGNYCEQLGQWQQAIKIYHKGLYLEPKHEAFNQRLLWCYQYNACLAETHFNT